MTALEFLVTLPLCLAAGFAAGYLAGLFPGESYTTRRLRRMQAGRAAQAADCAACKSAVRGERT